MRTFRKGDIVTVRAVVIDDSGSDRMKLHYASEDRYDTFYAPRDDVNILRATFAVGDVVEFTPTGRCEDVNGKVIGIADDELWIEWKSAPGVVWRETYRADAVDLLLGSPAGKKNEGEAA